MKTAFFQINLMSQLLRLYPAPNSKVGLFFASFHLPEHPLLFRDFKNMSGNYSKKIAHLESEVASLREDVQKRNDALMDLKKQSDIQQALIQVLEISLLPISLKEQLEAVLRLVLEIDWLTLTKKGSVFLVEKSQELKLVAEENLPESLLTLCDKVSFGKCLCGKAAESQKLIFKNCVDADHDHRPEGMKPHGHYNIPIQSRGNVIGVLNLYVDHGHQSTELERNFLKAIANALAGVIERKRMEESLAKLSLTDPLTELPNRRKLFDEVTKSMSRVSRNHTKLAVFFIDLDKFKPINDILGHEAGDKVLKIISKRLVATNRINDTIGRLGGDEFILVAEDVRNYQDALIIKERIEKNLNFEIELKSNKVQLGCSIGIALYPDDSTEVEELISFADLDMYKEKQSKMKQAPKSA